MLSYSSVNQYYIKHSFQATGWFPANPSSNQIDSSVRLNALPNKPWPHDYKNVFMLNSADHEISMFDKSNMINLLEEILIYRKFHCFSLSNQTFKFDFSYTPKHQ